MDDRQGARRIDEGPWARALGAGIAAAVLALVLDGRSLLDRLGDLPPPWPVPSVALALLGVLEVALAVGGAATLAALLLVATQRLLGASGPATRARRRAALIAALPIGVVAALLVALTWRGTKWAAAFDPLLAGGVTLIAVVASGAFGIALGLRLSRSRLRAARASSRLLALVLVLGAAWADAHFHPRRYPLLHLALMLTAITAAAWIGASVVATARPPRARTRVLILALIVLGLPGALRIACGDVDGEDPLRRDVLLVRAPVAARILHVLSPAHAEESLDGDLSLLTRPPDPFGLDLELDAAFADRRRANVVLITIDTLRADHCGFLGYRRDVTPGLDLLASESVVFESAQAQYPSSRNSLASMFSGLYPAATEAARLALPSGGFASVPDEDTILDDLSGAWQRLACTALTPALTDLLFAYLPGEFDHYDAGGADHDRAARVTDRALAALAATDPERPHFLWAHYFDPHDPYDALAGPDLGDRMIDRYDREVAYADRHVGRLLDALRARPDWDRTIVVLHADHGEEFRDHGGLYHHSSLYQEQVHVPLVVRVPGLAPRRVPEPVELVDLRPTLLRLLDRPSVADLHGDDLTGLMRGAPMAGEAVAYSQFREEIRLDAVRVGDLKGVYDRLSRSWEVFDLAADAGEQRNLALARPDLVGRLERLRAAFLSLPSPGGEPIDGQRLHRRKQESLVDASDEDRVVLARAMAERGESMRMMSRMPELLANGERDRVKRAALGEIAIWGEGENVELVRGFLDPRRAVATDVRRAAVGALTRIGGREDAALLGRLGAATDDPELAFACLVGRGLLGDASAAPELVARVPALSGKESYDALAAIAVVAPEIGADAWIGLVLGEEVVWPYLLAGLGIIARIDAPAALIALRDVVAVRGVPGIIGAEVLARLDGPWRPDRTPIFRELAFANDADVRENAIARLRTEHPDAMADLEALQIRLDLVRSGAGRRDVAAELLDARSAALAAGLTADETWGAIVEGIRLARRHGAEDATLVRLAEGARSWGIAGADALLPGAAPSRLRIELLVGGTGPAVPDTPELLLFALHAETPLPPAAFWDGRAFVQIAFEVEGREIGTRNLLVTPPMCGIAAGGRTGLAVPFRCPSEVPGSCRYVLRILGPHGEILAELVMPRA